MQPRNMIYISEEPIVTKGNEKEQEMRTPRGFEQVQGGTEQGKSRVRVTSGRGEEGGRIGGKVFKQLNLEESFAREAAEGGKRKGISPIEEEKGKRRGIFSERNGKQKIERRRGKKGEQRREQ